MFKSLRITYLFTFLLIGTFAGTSFSQSFNLPLLSNWDDNTLPNAFYGAYNDIWGYVDGQGREYAILGAVEGTFFFDVTDPSNIVMVDFEYGKNTSNVIHRDYKTYQHYAYAVCDEGQSSLQIFDLQYLPDSVHKVYDDDALCVRAHDIYIADDYLYFASNSVLGGGFNALDIASLADPENPTFVHSLNSPLYSHCHDVHVRDDIAYCSNGNDGLFVYDVSNKTSPILLQSFTSYPEQGYNHSSWLSDDKNTLIFADETWGKGLKVYDISDLSNPVLKSIFRSNLLNVPNPTSPSGSIAHNPFMLGDKAFIAYYHDGVQVFDFSDPANVTNVAYYDTYSNHTNYSGYKGCWGVYPYLPSGNILGSDFENGLFVLDGTSVISGIDSPVATGFDINAFPNPFNNEMNITLSLKQDQEVSYQIFDMTGKLMYDESADYVAGVQQLVISTEGWANGIYLLKAKGEKQERVQKIQKF